MAKYMDISGIIADNAHAKDSGVSFGEHFGERSPNIEELSLMNRTPNLSAHSARAPSVQREKTPNTLAPPNNHFQVVNKWPANENTHLLGDVDVSSWPKYRLNIERTLNFTELVENKTLIERCKSWLRSNDAVVDTSSQAYYSCQSQFMVETMVRPSTSAVTRLKKQGNDIAKKVYSDKPKSKAGHSSSKIPIRTKSARTVLGDISSAVQQTNNQMAQKQTLGHKKQPLTHQKRIPFTYFDGKYPLRANTLWLVWECVALGVVATQSLRIRNTSDKLLTIKTEVVGNEFEVTIYDRGPFELEGNEARTIEVTFKPTKPGKCLGTLIFKPADWLDDTERKVYLCAYGGEAETSKK